MEENKKVDINNSMNRMLLLMEYDLNRTSKENVKLFMEQKEGTYAHTVKRILDGCDMGKDYRRNVASGILDVIARSFFDAFKGWGTDNKKWKAALDSLVENHATYGDLCYVRSSFSKIVRGRNPSQNGDFYRWIDDDINFDYEWRRFAATFQKMYEASLEDAKEGNVLNNFETFIKDSWGDSYKGTEQFSKGSGDYFIVTVPSEEAEAEADKYVYRLVDGQYQFID